MNYLEVVLFLYEIIYDKLLYIGSVRNDCYTNIIIRNPPSRWSCLKNDL